MNLNNRISKIIEYAKLSASEFADEIDVQRSSISHITAGRNKPSLDFLIKVKDRFPEIEWEWIIKGNGEMIKPEKEDVNYEEKNEKQKLVSLPDLFSIIDDENFGKKTENANEPEKTNSRESDISTTFTEEKKISNSQRLDIEGNYNKNQNTDNQGNKIKRIVLFFENGKFESFEP